MQTFKIQNMILDIFGVNIGTIALVLLSKITTLSISWLSATV